MTVLSLTGLQEQWKYLLPLVVVLGFVLAVPIAWMLAPRLRARFEPDLLA